MACKVNIILFKIPCILIILISNNVFSKIIYDKNNISISELEFQKFNELYINSKNDNTFNRNKVLKELILQKTLINRLLKNQTKVINRIDEIIALEFGDEILADTTTLNFLRFMKIKNEFILNYFNDQFTINNFLDVLNRFDNLILPVSVNGCLTMIDKIDFKNNSDFAEILLNHFKNNQKKMYINIDKKNYEICITNQNLKKIENQITLYIENKTSNSFDNFIYGK